MYNRYIPRSDGSYQRRTLSDPPQAAPPKASPNPPAQEKPHRPGSPAQNPSIQTFLRQLLPKDMDTGDLIVILLLILMAGDCQEDRNNALLTAALYFIL